MDLDREQVEDAATKWLRSEHPSWTIERVDLFARESDRDVVRVWYRRELPTRPAPYKVLAVDHETLAVCEIDLRTHPQYAVRGHK